MGSIWPTRWEPLPEVQCKDARMLETPRRFQRRQVKTSRKSRKLVGRFEARPSGLQQIQTATRGQHGPAQASARYQGHCSFQDPMSCG